MSRNILFISVKTIKERTGLTNNVDEKLINPEILSAQDIYLLPCLGSALYERLQDGIENQNLTVNEGALIDRYITPTLVYYVMSELPIGLSYQFYNKGLIRKSGDGQENPSMQEMIDVANRYKARAEFYKQRLIKYLIQVSYTNLFPEYNTFGNGVDAIMPERNAYEISIFLGDNGCCGKSFSERYQGNIDSCCNE